MKICVFGNKHLTKEFIELCFSQGVPIDTLICISTSEVDTKQISGFDSYLASHAKSLGCRIFFAKKYSLNDEASLKFFAEEKFDLGIRLGWQRLIPGEILKTFSNGVFGWHGSLFKFPNGRGRSPINWSIRLGAKKIYLNLFRYDSEADNGALYETIGVDIGPNEYVSEVQKRLVFIEKDSFLRLISSIKNRTLLLKEQPVGPFIMFPKLSEESGFVQVAKITRDEALKYREILLASLSRCFCCFRI